MTEVAMPEFELEQLDYSDAPVSRLPEYPTVFKMLEHPTIEELGVGADNRARTRSVVEVEFNGERRRCVVAKQHADVLANEPVDGLYALAGGRIHRAKPKA